LKKKPKVKIKSNREEIVAINEKAKEQRLSYGQLVALQYLKEHSQNEKNIIGTWKNSNSENVITVQDSDTLILYNDIPEAGLYHGNASYHFSYTDTICVTQDDISAEFCVDVDENQLIIYFAGQVYLVLQK
jgi:hypothetical protein